MPLGYTHSTVAPQIFQNTGAAISDTIRQIGRDVAANVERIQTERQLQALGQEMKLLDPNSIDFPKTLLSTLTKYPLAMKDERGQLATQVLMQSHKSFLGEESAQRDFNRQSALEGQRHRRGMEEIQYREKLIRGRPVEMTPGSSLYDPLTGEEVFSVPNRPLAGGGFTLSPGATRYDAQGNPIATAPAKSVGERPMTPYQEQSINLREREMRVSGINKRIDEVERLIKSREQSLANSPKSEKAHHAQELQKLGEELRGLQTQRDEILPIPVSPGQRNRSMLGTPQLEMYGPPIPAGAPAASVLPPVSGPGAVPYQPTVKSWLRSSGQLQ